MKTSIILLVTILTLAGYKNSDGPVLAVNSLDYDFGKVQEGKKVEHIFVLRNTGDSVLKIGSVTTSCGCTVALLDTNEVAPGGTARIRAVFNSANKALGKIRKTIAVVSNARNNPRVVLSVSCIVVDPPGHSVPMHITGIFEGNCASCHADRGEGLLGMALFREDCAICHGPKEADKPAPFIERKIMLNFSDEELTKIISNGIPKTNMPGFAKPEGGPLDQIDIASIVEYFDDLKAEFKNIHYNVPN